MLRLPVGLSLGVVALVAASLGACEPSSCADADLDGLCAGTEDCDDDNAARGLDCDAVPPPDCDDDPTATGCPCLAGSATDCFPGAPEHAGVGLCTPGRTRCVAGHWGLCDGSRAPTGEVCDGADQDCDGESDEGVRSPCGGCDPACLGGLWGEPFTRDDGDEGIALTARGELTLAVTETAHGTVWVANTAEGTASRIDAAAAIETARYLTGDRAIAHEPARVAVDRNGDAWVANRAFGEVPSVVRIAGSLDRCVDRDADGTIETSAGPTDVRPWGEDECVLAWVPVGEASEVARAIAIDGDRGLDAASGGDAWIGLHDGEAIVEVDGLSGAILRRIETPGFQPYAAAFDPWGTLWAIARDGLLARVDPVTGEARVSEVPLRCWLLYSLAIDGQGRIATTGFSCDQIALHDPRTGRWWIEPTEASPRGAAFDRGELWVAHTGGLASRIQISPTLAVDQVIALTTEGVEPIESIGMAADGIGHLWAISEAGGPDGRGIASRIERDGTVSAQVVVGVAPHSQGDPTGAQTFGEPAPEGVARHVFDGCADGGTSWHRVHVAAQPGTHGAVQLEVRHADLRADLEDSGWTVLGTLPADEAPFPLELPEGGAIELRVTLRVNGSVGLPRVARVGVEWACPGPM